MPRTDYPFRPPPTHHAASRHHDIPNRPAPHLSVLDMPRLPVSTIRVGTPHSAPPRSRHIPPHPAGATLHATPLLSPPSGLSEAHRFVLPQRSPPLPTDPFRQTSPYHSAPLLSDNPHHASPS